MSSTRIEYNASTFITFNKADWARNIKITVTKIDLQFNFRLIAFEKKNAIQNEIHEQTVYSLCMRSMINPYNETLQHFRHSKRGKRKERKNTHRENTEPIRMQLVHCLSQLYCHFNLKMRRAHPTCKNILSLSIG